MAYVMRIRDWSSDVCSSDLEGRLLDLGEEVLRIAVQRHRADLDQRIVLVRPGLGEIEGIDAIGLGVAVGHDLNRQRPARMLVARDRLEEIEPREVRIAR